MIVENYNELYDAFKAQAVDPVGFTTLARPGRIPPDPAVCLRVQCGNLTQADVGPDVLADCAFGGFAGAKSCHAPLCGPYCEEAPPIVRAQEKVFLEAAHVEPSGEPPIPYSPSNGPEPNPFFGRSKLGNERKRRRGHYQEMVKCPGGEVSLFEVGWNTWAGGFEAVGDKMHVLGDMEFLEIAGLLAPPVIVTGLAWLLFGTRQRAIS